jgi:hypothetical protein
VLNSVEGSEMKAKDHPMLWEFKDVFTKEVPGLPPKGDLYFSIIIVPGPVPTSKVPYYMSTLELVDLKVHLKEMLDKGYIRLRVSPWGAPNLLVKKKDGTLILCID